MIRRWRKIKKLGTSLDSSTDFHGGRIHHFTIYFRLGTYSPDSDELRFILLHEEGHLRTPEFWQVYIAALVVVTMSIFRAIVPNFPITQWWDIPWMILLFLIIAIFSWKICLPILRLDEYRADRWASMELKAKYGVSKPSTLLHRTLSSLNASRRSLNRYRERVAGRYWAIMLRIFGDPHPTDEQRVRRIAEIVDD